MVAEVFLMKFPLRWMPLYLTDDKSTLVQLMAWCRQATSHYLSQCWPRPMSPCGVTRHQWVKLKCLLWKVKHIPTNPTRYFYEYHVNILKMSGGHRMALKCSRLVFAVVNFAWVGVSVFSGNVEIGHGLTCCAIGVTGFIHMVFQLSCSKKQMFWKNALVTQTCTLNLYSSLCNVPMYYVNRMAWQWVETLVEIRGIIADIRGTAK